MTLPDGNFVCAFRGRRDSYQAPLALAEGGLLDQFITDAYALPWMLALAKVGPARLRSKIEFRSEPGVPIERIRCLFGTTLVEHARHRLGFAPMLTFSKLDRVFSDAAAARAARTRSHLFLYSPYAWEAFTTKYAHAVRKILFQYHPHPDVERRILAADGVRHPEGAEPLSDTLREYVPAELVRRDRDVWQYADLIICASEFTRRSLLEAGADERLCCVIPYGVEPAVDRPETLSESFHALFVGSGGKRKGLHHLLTAWRQAILPRSSQLTLVCRSIDPQIERLARSTPSVRLIRQIPQSELNELYAGSSLFVMPSLVEGFGQVYLEALAQGCPILGTPNTCLPDIGGESDGIFLVTAGEPEELTSTLEYLSIKVAGNRALRRAARACAARQTWPAFRKGIRRALKADR